MEHTVRLLLRTLAAHLNDSLLHRVRMTSRFSARTGATGIMPARILRTKTP